MLFVPASAPIAVAQRLVCKAEVRDALPRQSGSL